MFSLNLSEDNRILSACMCLEGFEYDNIINTLPEGNISDYKYFDGEYVYEQLPQEEIVEELTIEEEYADELYYRNVARQEIDKLNGGT